jgi:acetoin utilization deacetylase AcuC-like enzyme
MSFSPGAYEIAALAAGATIELVDSVMGLPPAQQSNGHASATDGAVNGAAGGEAGAAEGEGPQQRRDGGEGGGATRGAYGLLRPPGHHAERSAGMG